jgi:hypothetical protein
MSFPKCRPVAKHIVLHDGTKLSVQCGWAMYSHPRKDYVGRYYAVGVGFPSRVIPEIMEYCDDPEQPTNTIYAYVPVKVLIEVFENAGGIANFNELPNYLQITFDKFKPKEKNTLRFKSKTRKIS